MIVYRLDTQDARTVFNRIVPEDETYDRYSVRDHGWYNCEPFVHTWMPAELEHRGLKPKCDWKLLPSHGKPVLSERGIDTFRPLLEPYGELLECRYRGERVFVFHSLIMIDPFDHDRVIHEYGNYKGPFNHYRQVEFLPDGLPDPGMFKLPDVDFFSLFLSTSEPDKFELLRLLDADRDFTCTPVWAAENYRRPRTQGGHGRQQSVKQRRREKSESATFVYQVNINDTRTRFNFIDPDDVIGIRDLGYFESLRSCEPYGDAWKPLEIRHLGKKPQDDWELLPGQVDILMLSERGIDKFKPLLEPYGEFLECRYEDERVLAFRCLIMLDPLDHKRIIYEIGYREGPFFNYRQVEFLPEKLPDPGLFRLPEVDTGRLFFSTGEPDRFELLKLLDANPDFQCKPVWSNE